MPQAETSAWPTDGTAMFVPTTDHEGEPVFVVLAKRTYELRPGGLVPTEKPKPLELVDVYHDNGDPQTHTVRQENETRALQAQDRFRGDRLGLGCRTTAGPSTRRDGRDSGGQEDHSRDRRSPV